MGEWLHRHGWDYREGVEMGTRARMSEAQVRLEEVGDDVKELLLLDCVERLSNVRFHKVQLWYLTSVLLEFEFLRMA